MGQCLEKVVWTFQNSNWSSLSMCTCFSLVHVPVCSSFYLNKLSCQDSYYLEVDFVAIYWYNSIQGQYKRLEHNWLLNAKFWIDDTLVNKCLIDWLNECISACQCSSAGSLHTACHLTTGKCSCKDNVEGHNCDSCKDGTYNLDVANPQGCLHCFGYGRALTCKSAEGFVASNTTSNFVNETGIY